MVYKATCVTEISSFVWRVQNCFQIGFGTNITGFQLSQLWIQLSRFVLIHAVRMRTKRPPAISSSGVVVATVQCMLLSVNSILRHNLQWRVRSLGKRVYIYFSDVWFQSWRDFCRLRVTGRSVLILRDFGLWALHGDFPVSGELYSFVVLAPGKTRHPFPLLCETVPRLSLWKFKIW